MNEFVLVAFGLNKSDNLTKILSKKSFIVYDGMIKQRVRQ